VNAADTRDAAGDNAPTLIGDEEDSMNETLQVIDGRASLRQYADRPIDRRDIERIVESAMRAPTAGNMMLYTILEVADPAKKARLAETCGHSFIAAAPLVLLFLADLQRWVDFFDSNGVPAVCVKEGRAYRTPDAAKLLTSCSDALAAAENSVIAAESIGIGSCYVGDILGHAEEHRALFGLPEFALPLALVCYGYRPEGAASERAERFDAKYIHHQDAYRRFSQLELAEMLAHIEAKFAHVLAERKTNLADLTYRSFMASPAADEQRRSVATLLAPWLRSEDARPSA